MKKPNYYVLLFLILYQFSSGQNDMKSLSFLVGTWKAEDKNLYEQWKLNDEGLAGKSYKINSGIEKEQERLTLMLKDGEINFIATVHDQNQGKSIPFKLNKVNENVYSFENPNHDFPKKIRYEKKGDSLLLVNVTGDEGQGFSFQMVKIEPPKMIPQWFMEHCKMTIGKWIANNSEYQSENEPYPSYGIEWTWGIGKTSVIGRLFGIIDSTEEHDFWQFRHYWDNENAEAIVLQLGNGGVVGKGYAIPTQDGKMETYQTFSLPDGRKWKEKHLNFFLDGNFTSTSFQLDDEGSWKEQRTYIWKKQ